MAPNGYPSQLLLRVLLLLQLLLQHQRLLQLLKHKSDCGKHSERRSNVERQNEDINVSICVYAIIT